MHTISAQCAVTRDRSWIDWGCDTLPFAVHWQNSGKACVPDQILDYLEVKARVRACAKTEGWAFTVSKFVLNIVSSRVTFMLLVLSGL